MRTKVTKRISIRAPGALVTGGAQRLGRAITRSLSIAGYAVAIHYHRSKKAARELADHLNKYVGDCHLVEGDLTEHRTPSAVVEQAAHLLGGLHLLVNNAGILVPDKASDSAIIGMRRLNVDAPRDLIEYALPYLVKTGGSVVNIADIAGLQSFDLSRHYSQTKRELIELTRTKALELATLGVRLNAIAPGLIWPPDDFGESRVSRLIEKIPLKCLGDPENVGEAVVFLARARFVTGQILSIDGGQTLT